MSSVPEDIYSSFAESVTAPRRRREEEEAAAREAEVGYSQAAGLTLGLLSGINRAGLYTGQGGEAIASILDDYESTKGIAAFLDRVSKEQIAEETGQLEALQKYRTSREDIGLGSVDEIAAGIAYYSEAFAEQLPLIATGIAATIGTAAALPLLGVGATATAVGAAVAGTSTQVPYFFGSNITRQKEVIEDTGTGELDYTSAITAAGLQSVASQAANLVGIKLIPRIGKSATDNLMSNIGKAGEGLFSVPKSRLKSAAKGAGFTGAVEGVTEAGQQFLERWQAGLPLLSDEAIEEYTTSAVDGFVLGGLFGGATGTVGVDTLSMVEKGETAKAVKKKLDDLDTKISEELETAGEDAPSWKGEQISREVRSEAFFEDAEAYYKTEVDKGRDPEEVKGEIATELERVLLIEADREVAPTQLQTPSSSIQEKATVAVGSFLDTLGTPDVQKQRPDLEPDIKAEPEIDPEARQELTDEQVADLLQKAGEAEDIRGTPPQQFEAPVLVSTEALSESKKEDARTILAEVENAELDPKGGVAPISFLEITEKVIKTPEDRDLAAKIKTRLSEFEERGVPVPTVLIDPNQELYTTEEGVMLGKYNSAENVIYLNPDKGGLSSQPILHELAHAVLLPTVDIARRQPANSPLRETVAELDTIQGIIEKEVSSVLDPYTRIRDGKKVYEVPKDVELPSALKDITEGSNVFADVDETLAWTLTNPEAKKYLEGITVPESATISKGGKIKNLWNAFVDVFARLIGIEPKNTTALAKVLDVSDQLFAADLDTVVEGVDAFVESRKGVAPTPITISSMKDLLGFIKEGKRPTVEAKPKPKVKRKPKLEVKEKPKSVAAVIDKTAREKFDRNSQKAMANKIIAVIDKNTQQEMEAANQAPDVFRPNEENVSQYLPASDVDKITALLDNEESSLLEGKNKNKKTPASAAWNYFKGYKKPESALKELAWAIGVGAEANPAFSRASKKVLTSPKEDKIGEYFLSPWEEAFFTDTGGDNTLLFLDWVENNLSDKTLVNIKRLAEVYRRRNDAINTLPSGLNKFQIDRQDPFDPSLASEVRTIERGTSEFNEIVAHTDEAKRQRVIADYEAERTVAKKRRKTVSKKVTQSRVAQRKVEIASIQKGEIRNVEERFSKGVISSTERDALLAEIKTKYEAMKGVEKLYDAEATFALNVLNLLDGKKDSLPLTVEAAKELDMLAEPRLIDLIDNTKKSRTRLSKVAVALQYIYSTTKDKNIKRVVRAFYAQVTGESPVILSLTDKKLFDVNGVELASNYNPETKVITINKEYLNTRALLHELAHALTHETIKKKNIPAVKELKQIYEDVKEIIGDTYAGTGGFEEFVAEAFSNANFRRTLAGINPQGDKVNSLQKFTAAVRRLLNAVLRFLNITDPKPVKLTALDEIDQILDAIVPPVTDTASGLSGATDPDTIDEVFKLIEKANTERSKLLEGLSNQRMLNILIKASRGAQVAFSYAASNQTFADIANAIGLKGKNWSTLDIDKLLMRLKGVTDKVNKQLEFIINDYQKWATKAGVEGVKAFNDVIYDINFGATITQVDPTLTKAEAIKKYGKNSAKFGIWEQQRPAWNKIRTTVAGGKNGHDIYKMMNKYYTSKFLELRSLLTGKVTEVVREQNKNKSEKEVQKELDRIKKDIFAPVFKKQPLEVYFPLTREGTFAVSFSMYDEAVDPDTGFIPPEQQFTYELYKSEADALARIRELNQEIKKVNDKKARGENLTADERWFEAVNVKSLNKTPDNINKLDKKGNPTEATLSKEIITRVGTLVTGADDATKQQITDMFIDLLPEYSFAKQLQTRKGTPGYISDALFALQTKGRSLGVQMERLKTMPDAQLLRNQIQNAVVPEEATAVEASLFQSFQLGALKKVDDLIAPPPPNLLDQFASAANAYAFLMTIGFNVSSAAVNLSQIPLVIQHRLAGIYGLAPSLKAMRLAFKYITISDGGFSIGLENYYDYNVKTDTFSVKTTMPQAYKKDLQKLKPLIDLLRRKGLLTVSAIDQQFAQYHSDNTLVRQAGAKGDNLISLDNFKNYMNKTVAASGIFFSGAEKISRQATLIATYILEIDRIQEEKSKTARIKGGGDKLTPRDYEKAVDESVYIMQETNGASFRESAPPITRVSWAAMGVMYKTFGMQMIYLQLKQLRAATKSLFRPPKGATQEQIDLLKKQRKAATTFLVGNMATGLFLSGIVGHTLYGAVQMFYDLYARIFRDDEDEDYKDFNRLVRETIHNLGWGDGLYRGQLAEITGLNAGDRMRLSGLLFQEDKFKRDLSFPEEVFHYIGGPAYSSAMKLQRAITNYKEDRVQRAIEEALPTGFANFVKATTRYAQEGARTKDNMIILDDMTTGELTGQFFGFTPMRLIRRQELTAERKYIERRIVSERKDLVDSYSRAYFHGDQDGIEASLKKIGKFNTRHNKMFPGYTIKRRTLKNSLEARKRGRRDLTHNGVRFDRGMSEFLQYQEKMEREIRSGE